MIRVPQPKPTFFVTEPATKTTKVYCAECEQLVAWVADRMRREQPARARAMLGAHHLTNDECKLARSQA